MMTCMSPIGRGAVMTACIAAWPLPAAAQSAIDDSVVVSATRSERSSFDVPVSIDAVDGETLRDGQPQVNLSEALGRVPGLVIQNRHNYAQDLQVSIRGSGARATFGIRGVRLYADGIPATMPDGQGQASNFALSSAGRIEVMRGPVAALYGNASGGVIQLFTEEAPRTPTLSADLLAGNHGTWRSGAKLAGRSGALDALVDVSRFHTDGYRAHSAARRDQFNSRLGLGLGEATRAILVFNHLDMPETQDPLGLRRAQVRADPRQVDSAAIMSNTRKSVTQSQLGATLEHRLDGSNRLRASAYAGDRQVTQFLGILPPVQIPATHSGGVVDLDRYFGGANLNWLHQSSLFGQPFNATVGLEHELMQERRRGFVNNFGVSGALKRDEDNRVTSTNLFAQGDWRFAERWSATAGLRNTRIEFESRDYFVSGATNRDDSGRVSYSNTSPVGGLSFRLLPEISLYASAGRGFETPTFAELAYRSAGAGPGLNFALLPARSSNAELGVKGRLGDAYRFSLARFETATRDEIVVESNTGGRATFKNAGRTRRSGWEAALQAVLPAGFDAQVSWTLLDARYAEAFTTAVGAPAVLVTVPAGNRIPGVPGATLYAELRWKHFASGFSAVFDARRSGKVYVNDLNADAAEAYTVVNLRAGFEQRARGWRLAETLRVDNLGNRAYVGSVIVGDGNGRFFEPAQKRTVAVILSASLEF